MQNKFPPNNYFDLSDFAYKDIFADVENVWDVIHKISAYLDGLFSSGKIKGNYAENVYVANSSFVDTTARIEGPAIIEEQAIVGFHAYVHPNVIVDKNAVVGTGSEVKNSILLNTCKISHANYVSDSLLGNKVRMGVGAVIVNKRVDRQTIKISLKDRSKIETGLTRFGSIIGDSSRIGANAVINPGTIIGKNTLVYPLESVFGFHEDDEIIK